MERLPAPDFPTGAVICGSEGIRQAYRTGRGLLIVRARAALEVLVNVTMWVDTKPAAASDDIADAANYRTISKAIISHIESGKPMLVERLVQELADLILGMEPRCDSVEVRVEKPGALRHARSVGITIRRSRVE